MELLGDVYEPIAPVYNIRDLRLQVYITLKYNKWDYKAMFINLQW